MKTTELLNHLIETLKDGHAGFRDAAENVDSPDLQHLFRQYSLQRSGFASELQAVAESLGEPEPEESGTVAGALHRGWINLKAAFASNDAHAVLTECERGEDHAVAQFEKALAEPALPPRAEAVIRSQYLRICEAHYRIRALRDSLVTP